MILGCIEFCVTCGACSLSLHIHCHHDDEIELNVRVHGPKLIEKYLVEERTKDKQIM